MASGQEGTLPGSRPAPSNEVTRKLAHCQPQGLKTEAHPTLLTYLTRPLVQAAGEGLWREGKRGNEARRRKLEVGWLRKRERKLELGRERRGGRQRKRTKKRKTGGESGEGEREEER